MANTYTQIYVQIVFAVQGRQSLIRPQHNDELQKYMTGIISGQGHKLIAINNMPDHFHILVGQRPERRAFRFGSRHKGWIIGVHQRSALGAGTVFLAKRVWSVFVLSLASRWGHSIHSKSARASSRHNVPRRISRIAEAL